MPLIKSAKKALRRDRRRTDVNRKVRVRLKEAVKNTRVEKSSESLAIAYSALDRAAKKKVIHKTKASRLKSRLAALVKRESPKGAKRAGKKTAKKAGMKTKSGKKK